MARVSFPVSAFAADWDGHMGGGGWMWLWGSLMILALVAVVVLVVWVVALGTRGHGPAPGSDPTDRARSILAERLARGEIEPDEYNDRLRHLA